MVGNAAETFGLRLVCSSGLVGIDEKRYHRFICVMSILSSAWMDE